MKILVTGASGFIGSFLCEKGHERGDEVWAGMRLHSSKRHLQGDWVNFITLQLDNEALLREQLLAWKERYGRWDAIIHAGGVTKCLRREDFDRNNFDCTRHLVNALIHLDMVPGIFVYVSSLSVTGPIKEKKVKTHPLTPLHSDPYATDDFIGKYTVEQSVYEEITDSDEPHPNTAYGISKLKSERFLHSLKDFPYVIMRPTGVYGPREKDYLMMAESIKKHMDFSVGYQPQEITFVHVHDLVGVIYAAIDRRREELSRHEEHSELLGKAFFVTDGYVYYSRAFSDLIQHTIGVKGVVHIKAPLFVLRSVSFMAESFSKLRKKASTLNGDKYKIMKQRNWQCDIRPMIDILHYHPQWNLQRGVEETFGSLAAH